MLKLGVIGYGKRINSIVKLLINSEKVKLVAITDTAPEAASKKYSEHVDFSDVKLYTDAEEMIKNEKLDGVAIGTRCSSHTKYAVLAAKYGLPTFLEKPVCTTEEDLARLEAILPEMNEKTVVSFPMRTSRIIRDVKAMIDSGKIGKLAHVEAVNNVAYGRGYYQFWYRDESETGGLFLQKATHDIDYINYLLGLKPVSVCAMSSKQIFTGDKPVGLKCSQCPEHETCHESPEYVAKHGNGYTLDENCCFAVDTGNEDSGSMIIEYENGLHTVYTQDFVVRNGAGKRGARIIGYLGTIEFNWTDPEITFYDHADNNTEKIIPEMTTEYHGGGDKFLADNFIEIMEGTATSQSTLYDGIMSAKICLAARRSAKDHVFVSLK